MESYNKEIFSFLSAFRRKFLFFEIFKGIFMLSSVLISVLFICSSVVKLFPFPYVGVLFSFICLSLGLYVFVKYLIYPTINLSLKKSAFLIEKNNVGLNEELTNSYFLTSFDKRYVKQFSSSLINEMAKEVSLKLNDIKLKGAMPLVGFKNEFLKLLSLVIIFLLVNNYYNKFILNGFSAISHPVKFFLLFKGDDILKTKFEPIPPRVGDIKLVYNYPSYTDLKSLTVSDSNGDINAIKGTAVTVFAKTNKDTKDVFMKMEGITVPMKKKDGRNISGVMTIMESGSYEITALGLDDSRIKDPVLHSVNATDDKFPLIALLYPEDMIEVKIFDEVELQYKFSDDFGIGKLELIYEVSDKDGNIGVSKRIKIKSDEKGKKGFGKYSWDLSLMKLTEGGGVRYHLEIFDNDTISGPKVSESAEYYLSIYDSKKGHEDVIFSQEKIFEDTITLLADELESPFSAVKGSRSWKEFKIEEYNIDESVKDILSMINELLLSLKEDTLSDPKTYLAYSNIFERLKSVNDEKKEQFLWIDQNIESLFYKKTNKFVENFRLSEINEIEIDVIEMDRLIKMEKMNSLKLDEEEIMDARESLLDLISNMSEMNKDSAMEKFKEGMDKIENLLSKFMEKMSKMSKELPDEFVNSEAFKDLDPAEVDDYMEKIKKALQEGDLEKAAELAAEFLSQMENMMDSLMDSADDMMDDSLYSDMENINNALSAVNELMEKEEELLKDTSRLDEMISKKLRKDMERKMNEFKEKIKELVRKLNISKDALKNELIAMGSFNGSFNSRLFKVKKNIESMLNALDTDFKDSRSKAIGVKNSLKRLLRNVSSINKPLSDKNRVISLAKESSLRAEKIVDEFNKLMKSSRDMLSESDRKMMKNMSSRQDVIKQLGEEFKESIEELGDLEALMGSKMMESLKNSIEGMGKAKGGLGKGKMSTSLEGEREAMNNLSDMSKGLSGLQKKLGGMMGKMGGKPGMGKPMQFGKRHGKRVFKGKVNIPEEGDFKVKREFRDDILDAMGGSSPKKYKDMNSKYYNELVK